MAVSPEAVVTQEQAGSQISDLLADDPDYRDEEPSTESSKEEASEAGEEAAEVEAASSDAEEEPETESEAEEIEIDFDSPMFEVEEGRKVSLNQLKKEHLLQSDYTKKTQELATEKAKVQEELNKGLNTQREEYLTALDTQQQLLIQMVAPQIQNLDKLAEEDPAEYIRAKNQLDKINELVRGIDGKRRSEQEKYQEYVRTQVLPKELELTKQVIPEWSDDLKPVLVETGKKYGFNDDEMSVISDHRVIKILHELNRLTKLEQSLTASKEVSNKKVIAKPKVLKSGTRNSQDKEGGDNFKKLRKSGRFQDAASVIAQRLGDME